MARQRVADLKQLAGPGAARSRRAAGAAFDGVGGDTGRAAFGLLGAGGRFCPFGMASGSFAPVTAEARPSAGCVRRGQPPSAERLRALSEAALAEGAAGRIRPVIGQEAGLAEAAAAHAAIEARTTIGKTLLRVPG